MRGVYKLIRTRNKASTVFPSLSSLTQRDDYQRVPFCVLELTARCNSSGSKPLMTISVEWLTEPRLSLLTEMRRLHRRRRPSESRASKRLTPTVCKFSSPSDRTGPVLRNASCFFFKRTDIWVRSGDRGGVISDDRCRSARYRNALVYHALTIWDATADLD